MVENPLRPEEQGRQAPMDSVMEWMKQNEKLIAADDPNEAFPIGVTEGQKADEPVKKTPAGKRLQSAKPTPDQKPQRKGQSGVMGDLLALLLKIGWICLFFGAVLVFVVGVTVQSGTAMEPAFHDRDVVFYYRLDKTPEAGEAVVYTDEAGKLLVGRVVAVGGDTVEITAEGVKVNGYYQMEPYASGETILFREGVEFPVTVKGGEFFVLCDNRGEGRDSRILGPIPEKQIKGRVMLSVRQRDF